jgi:hypothetical protein
LAAGEISLAENSVIVNEVRVADKATIVVSEGHEGSLELNGDFPVGAEAILADVKGGLSMSTSSGDMFKWLAADDTIPILGLIRPVIPGDAGAGGDLWQRLRDLFKRRQWQIREIPLVNHFQEADGLTGVTLALPDNNYGLDRLPLAYCRRLRRS